MFKAFFANFSDKKFALMFLTSAIYILGLVGFYNNNVPLVLGLTLFILILGLIKEYISPKLAIFWLLIFSFAFLNAAHRHKQFDELFHLAPQNATIIGQVTTIPDNGLETRTRFFFDVKEITYENKTELVNAKTFVNVKGKPDIRIGETYKLEGKLRTPNTVSNPSQFDYEKYLKNLNVFTTFFVDDAPIKIETTLTPKWAFLQGLNNVRQDILESHSKNIQSPNIEVLGGIVFGDDAVSPPDNIKQSFKDAGILHILAASGMNVALIFGIFFFIFRLLKIPSTIGNILGIFIIVLYTLMTGMGASIIRAAVILVFILIGKLIDRDAHSLSLLSFVALLMLIFNPSYINDVGFQLSFIVTFGLLLMTTPVLSKFNNIMPHWLSSSIFIPVIAQLWVAPIQMFYFNSFTLYSVFANILIMPFITVISFGGFISSVIATVKPIAPYVCAIFDFFLNPVISGLVFISDFFANLPHALVTMPKPNFGQILFYYLLLIILTFIMKNGFSKKILLSFGTTLLLLLAVSIKPSTGAELIFFDVQNADCFLYKTPSNKYFVIDTGRMGFNGNKSQINYVLLEYLKDNGIRNIEGLILTHFDADHAGGAEDLINAVNVKRVYVNSLNDSAKIAKRIYELRPDAIKPHNDSVIYTDKTVKIKAFLAEFNDKKFENENSLITLIEEGNSKILLMGDAGVTAFNKLKSDLPQHIDVLKVGHHGARGVVNSDMLNSISPKYSIISTGMNKYGHPNKVILHTLANTTILRTDRNNAIKIKANKAYVFDKELGWIEYLPF